MSTSNNPTTHAEKILDLLADTDTITTRCALRIANELLEYRVSAEAGAALAEGLGKSATFDERLYARTA